MRVVLAVIAILLAVIAASIAVSHAKATTEYASTDDAVPAPRCIDNSVCAAHGLLGDCCPTTAGDWLKCCSDKDNEVTHHRTHPLCMSNEACTKIGLVDGDCCPTSEGVFLDCCGGV